MRLSKSLNIWTLIGLVISISYIVYVEFFRQTYTDLDYIITTKSTVFDLKEPIPSLKIMYDEKQQIDTNESIVLINLRVVNTGNVHIKEEDYYSGSEFGFEVTTGTVLQNPEVIQTNIQDIEKSIEYMDSLQNIILPKIPIDIGEYYELKMLVISESDSIGINPIGKISGVSSIDVIETYLNEEGSNIDQPRWYVSLFIGIVGLLGGVNLTFVIYEWLKKKRKRKLLNRFKKKYKEVNVPKEIEELFFKFNKSKFEKLKDILTDEDKFMELYNSDKKVKIELNKQRQYDPVLDRIYVDDYCNHEHRYPLRKIFDGSRSMYKVNTRGVKSPELGLSHKFMSDMETFFEFLKHN